MQHTPYKTNRSQTWLYRAVFRHGRSSVVLAGLLLSLLLLQPLQPVYAADPEDTVTDSASEDTVAPEAESDEEGGDDATDMVESNDPPADSSDDPEPTEEDLSVVPTSTDESETTSDASAVATTTEDETDSAVVDAASASTTIEMDTTSETATSSAEDADSTSSSDSDDDVTATASSTAPSNVTSTTTATSTTSTSTSSVNASIASSSDDVTTGASSGSSDTNDVTNEPVTATDEVATDASSDEETDTVSESPTDQEFETDDTSVTEATSSPAVATEPVQTTHVSDTNRHQFSAEECVAVGDGSYYCSTTTASSVDTSNDVVYTKRNQEGYSEIYLQTAQGEQRITDNQYSDSAPHYDQQSASIVWHREIDGRFQIMSYDLRTQETKQLTNTSSHNMQPTRAGDHTVWQRWSNGHWQIVLSVDGVETQLTDQPVHNVAPYVYGTYVIWNTTGATGEPKIAVYDVATELISYITNDEGGRVRNPRFVLVYDTELANGDVLTQGFDPETGETEPLSSVPAAPLPDIPSPDPVGETRALLPQKTSSSSEDELIQSTQDDTDGNDLDTATTTAPVGEVASSTLDMTGATTTAAELSEYDLVVTPYSTTTASSTNDASAQETISADQ